jgi:3-dehydroquinate dehydratase/shikimate dehydrogenase
LLRRASDAGADYIDIEWKAGFDDLIALRQGRGIVLSHHEFQGVPADLAGRARAMQSTRAEVVKIAVKAERLTDNLPLLDLQRVVPSVVGVAMGVAGLPSRILATRFGWRWTYAGDREEVGQLTVDRLLDEFGFRRLTADTALFGVVGRPVSHSLSPALHNRAYEAESIDAVYLPLEAADVDDFLEFADVFPIAGASVTAPYKEVLMPRVARRDSLTERVGALNTLRRVDGVWHARNTDVEGFRAPLLGHDAACHGRAAVLGTGGAARAVVLALGDRAASITVYGRDVERAQRVASLVGGVGRASPPKGGTWDILVNATPVGTHPDCDATPVEARLLGGGLVYDLVFNPTRTRLRREAEAAGCATVGGLEMLVAQAAAQFEWWLGRRAPVAIMREAAESRLAQLYSADSPDTP